MRCGYLAYVAGVVCVSLGGFANDAGPHGKILREFYDTSDARKYWTDDLWWISCIFADMNGDGVDDVITTTVSQEDRDGCAWYFWASSPGGGLQPVQSDHLALNRFVFTGFSDNYYRMDFGDGRCQVVGLGLNAGYLDDGLQDIGLQTPDCVFKIETNNQLSVTKIEPSLDAVFVSSKTGRIERLYAEVYNGFHFDYNPNSPSRRWWGCPRPEPVAAWEAPEGFDVFVSAYRENARKSSGVTNGVPVYAVFLDADNNGSVDCYVTSSAERTLEGLYRWTLYISTEGRLEKATAPVLPARARNRTSGLEPMVTANIDAFCQVVHFVTPPTYIVLDADKVREGYVKKTITDQETHSIEKLPCRVYLPQVNNTGVLMHEQGKPGIPPSRSRACGP